MPVVVRKLDKQGCIVIPKEWRDKHAKVGKFVMMLDKGEIRMIPVGTVDLTKYFDSIEVDLKNDLSDWRFVRKELRCSTRISTG
jgi:bifunctional DNA-binding transcriptional regulator/antitoxin component of YhaV-PrlF toxin-antitoxin module